MVLLRTRLLGNSGLLADKPIQGAFLTGSLDGTPMNGRKLQLPFDTAGCAATVRACLRPASAKQNFYQASFPLPDERRL
jgi:hypothetical protein